MRTLLAVVFGFAMMFVVAMTAITLRPAYVVVTDSLNTTVHEINQTLASTVWDNWHATTNYLWWLIPSLGIIVILMYIWMNAQQKEYVTGVYG